MLEVGMKAPGFALPDKMGSWFRCPIFSARKWFCIFTRKIIRPVVQDKPARLRSKIKKSKTKTQWLSALAKIA